MFIALLACSPDVEPDDSDPPESESDSGDTADTSDTGDTGDTADPGLPPTRGLWVWNSNVTADPDQATELFAFSAERGITTLFLSCDPVGYGVEDSEEIYRNFIRSAHDEGLEVFAMSGYGWFTVPCDAGLEGQTTCFDEGWDLYEACAGADVGFDGIMDDSETYSVATDHWETNTFQRSKWVVKYLEGIRERIGELPLHHTIPAWYDEKTPFPLEEGGDEKTLDAWIADVVDVSAVMSYRDYHPAVLAVADTELGNGPVWLGQEICDAGEGDDVDYSREGEEVMLDEIRSIESSLADNENFVGVMVHSYDCWKDSLE